MKVKDIFEAFLPRDGAISERDADHELRIVVHTPGSLGGTPSVGLSGRGIQVGFDWDNGKLLLTPEVPLTRLTSEDVAAIHESVKKGQSWHAYDAYKKRDLKHRAEVKDLKAALEAKDMRIARLETALEALAHELIEEMDDKYQDALDYKSQGMYKLDISNAMSALALVNEGKK